MSNSENLNTFDENRDEFKPYGFTCEVWMPHLMRRADRHNEIEINYFTEGSMTYLFQGNQIQIPAKKLAIFWALIPHQIVHYEAEAPYYVCTIPLSQFLSWKLAPFFVERILKGEILIETSNKSITYDEYLLRNWTHDIKRRDTAEVALLEIRARLARLAIRNPPFYESQHSSVHSKESSQVVNIAVFIAQNYLTPIKASDIGQAVGLHPDYANSIFKQAFGCTMREYITEERISHAQRKLITTDSNITEIAFDCGFNSISRFNAAFLKINRCTPREFRKQSRTSD